MSEQSLAQLLKAKEIQIRLLSDLEETRVLARSAGRREILDDKLRVAMRHLRGIELVISASESGATSLSGPSPDHTAVSYWLTAPATCGLGLCLYAGHIGY